LFIRFVVSEDVQTRVADLRIEGNHAFGEQELLGVIASLAGQPYSDFNVATDRANILAQYFNEGFPEATFESEVQAVEEQAASEKNQQSESWSTDRAKLARKRKPVHWLRKPCALFIASTRGRKSTSVES